MLQSPGDIRLDLSPQPPLSLILQMVNLMGRHEFFDTPWQVISHIGYLLRRHSVAKSGMDLLFAHIEDFWHFSYTRHNRLSAVGLSIHLQIAVLTIDRANSFNRDDISPGRCNFSCTVNNPFYTTTR